MAKKQTAKRAAKPAVSQAPEQEKDKGGRPSKYRHEFAEQAGKLCQLGATDQELADFFGVKVRTLHRWKGEHDEFCHSLKAGKELADERVERALFQRAIGYEQNEVKIFMPANAEAPVYAKFRAKIAPDTTAAIFWLKNRRPDLWRDKSHTELSGAVAMTKAEDKTDTELMAIATASTHG